jgi:putative aldouronate transport system substrate-binding protein
MNAKQSRAISIAVAAMLVLSLVAGCTGGAQTGGGDQAGATTTAAASAAQGSAPAAETEGAAEAGSPGTGAAGAQAAGGTLSPDNPRTFDIFMNFTWYPVSKFEGIIPEEITRRTGITLNPTIAVDEQQLGVMIASNDLPDLIATDRMLSNLSTNDLCYDWGALIEQHGIDWDIPQVNIANSLSFTQEEGKFFTLLSHFSSTEDWKTLIPYGVGAAMTGSLLYRRDLYEQMGSPKLESMEDIKQMLIQAHEAYPDITTLYFDKVSWQFSYFRENFGFGQHEAKFVENTDGEWVPYIKHDNYIPYMKYVNELFRAGCIIPDNYAMEGTAVESLLEAGGGFAYSHCTQDSANQRTAALQQVIPEAVFYEAPVLGDPDGYFQTSIGWMGTFISKGCPDPELALQFLKYMHSDEGAKLSQWGREGQEYTIDANGVPTFSAEWSAATLDGTMEERYNTWFYLGGSKILEAVARCGVFDPDQYSNYPTLREHFSNLPWVIYAAPVEGSDERIIYDKLFIENTGLLADTEAKLVMSQTDEEFDKNYADMLSKADSAGLAQLETYMKEHIAEAMEVYGVQ